MNPRPPGQASSLPIRTPGASSSTNGTKSTANASQTSDSSTPGIRFDHYATAYEGPVSRRATLGKKNVSYGESHADVVERIARERFKQLEDSLAEDNTGTPTVLIPTAPIYAEKERNHEERERQEVIKKAMSTVVTEWLKRRKSWERYSTLLTEIHDKETARLAALEIKSESKRGGSLHSRSTSSQSSNSKHGKHKKIKDPEVEKYYTLVQSTEAEREAEWYTNARWEQVEFGSVADKCYDSARWSDYGDYLDSLVPNSDSSNKAKAGSTNDNTPVFDPSYCPIITSLGEYHWTMDPAYIAMEEICKDDNSKYLEDIKGVWQQVVQEYGEHIEELYMPPDDTKAGDETVPEGVTAPDAKTATPVVAPVTGDKRKSKGSGGQIGSTASKKSHRTPSFTRTKLKKSLPTSRRSPPRAIPKPPSQVMVQDAKSDLCC